MPAYDHMRFVPPAPVALVELRGAADRSISDVPMLLDTGADVSLVPHLFVEQLNVPVDPSVVYELMGFDGRTSTARAVQLELIFLERTFRGRFLLVDQDYGIIGRDILNHVSCWTDQTSPGTCAGKRSHDHLSL